MSTIKAEKLQSLGSKLNFLTGATPTQRLTIDENGNVGIGTVTPTAKLQTIDTYNAARFGANNANSLTIGSHGGSPYSGIGYNINFDSGADNLYFAVGADRTSLIRFANGGFEFKGNATNGAVSGTPFALTDYMTILDSGLVGIGTSYPAYKLVVGANNGNALEFGPEFAEGNNLLQSYNRTTSVYTKLTSTALSHAICVGTSGTEKVTIDSSGRVGIGTTAPAVALDVAGEARSSTSTTRASNAKTLTTKDYVDDGTNGTRIGTTIVFSGIRYDTAYSRFGISHSVSTNTITLPTGTWSGFVIKDTGGTTTAIITQVVDRSGPIIITAWNVGAETLCGTITRTA